MALTADNYVCFISTTGHTNDYIKENLDVDLECDDYSNAYCADLSDRAIEKLEGIQDG